MRFSFRPLFLVEKLNPQLIVSFCKVRVCSVIEHQHHRVFAGIDCGCLFEFTQSALIIGGLHHLDAGIVMFTRLVKGALDILGLLHFCFLFFLCSFSLGTISRRHSLRGWLCRSTTAAGLLLPYLFLYFIVGERAAVSSFECGINYRHLCYSNIVHPGWRCAGTREHKEKGSLERQTETDVVAVLIRFDLEMALNVEPIDVNLDSRGGFD